MKQHNNQTFLLPSIFLIILSASGMIMYTEFDILDESITQNISIIHDKSKLNTLKKKEEKREIHKKKKYTKSFITNEKI